MKDDDGRDCLGCGVALIPGFSRCAPCRRELVRTTKDPKALARYLLKSPEVKDGCYAECGSMGSCHPNLWQEVRILAKAVLK